MRLRGAASGIELQRVVANSNTTIRYLKQVIAEMEERLKDRNTPEDHIKVMSMMRQQSTKIERACSLLQQIRVQSQEVSNGTRAEATSTDQSIFELVEGVRKDIQQCQHSFERQHENFENVMQTISMPRTALYSAAHNMPPKSRAPAPRNPILAMLAGATSPLEEAKTTIVAEAHHPPKA